MNRQYLKNIDNKDLILEIKNLLKNHKININDEVQLIKMIEYAKPRVNTKNEIINEILCFFNCEKNNFNLLENYEYKLLGEFWSKELNKISTINENYIKNIIKSTSDELKISGKNLFIPLRLLLIGKEHGPDLYTIINILDKEESIKRLKLNTAY